MMPNVKTHNPCPEYVKKIITDTGMSINDVAKILGISIRMMRYYTSKRDNKPIPYCVQYSIESLKK